MPCIWMAIKIGLRTEIWPHILMRWWMHIGRRLLVLHLLSIWWIILSLRMHHCIVGIWMPRQFIQLVTCWIGGARPIRVIMFHWWRQHLLCRAWTLRLQCFATVAHFTVIVHHARLIFCKRTVILIYKQNFMNKAFNTTNSSYDLWPLTYRAADGTVVDWPVEDRWALDFGNRICAQCRRISKSQPVS